MNEPGPSQLCSVHQRFASLDAAWHGCSLQHCSTHGCTKQDKDLFDGSASQHRKSQHRKGRRFARLRTATSMPRMTPLDSAAHHRTTQGKSLFDGSLPGCTTHCQD